jgi:hypothetical protein
MKSETANKVEISDGVREELGTSECLWHQDGEGKEVTTSE